MTDFSIKQVSKDWHTIKTNTNLTRQKRVTIEE